MPSYKKIYYFFNMERLSDQFETIRSKMETKRFNVVRLLEDLLIEVLVRLPVKHLLKVN